MSNKPGTDIILMWSQKNATITVEKKMAVLPQAEGEDRTNRETMFKGNKVSNFRQTGRISVLVLIPNIERRAYITVL